MLRNAQAQQSVSEKDPQLSFLTAKPRWRSVPQMSEENAERKLIIEMVDLVVVFRF